MHPSHRDNSALPKENEAPINPAWGYYPPYYSLPQEEEIDLLDYFRVLWKRKWLILAATLLVTGLAAGYAVKTKKKYIAEVSLMTLSSNSGGGLSGLVSQMGSLPLVGGALGDLGGIGGGKSKELINILKSRTIAEKLISKFDLLKVIFIGQFDPNTQTFFKTLLSPAPVLEDGVKVLREKIIKVEDEKKTGLIKISVTMKDPVLAAKMANQMVLELQDFIENNSLTLAKRNRIFLEEQLVKTRAKLIEAGKELNQFYSSNKISSVVPQIDVDVGSYQVAPKPFDDFRKDLESLKDQQVLAESNKNHALVQNVPGQVYLQFLTLNRELLAKTYALLLQQYEIAKIDEAKEDLAFQVIDKATVKVRHAWPKPLVIIGVGFALGLFFGVFLAFVLDFIQKVKAKEIAA